VGGNEEDRLSKVEERLGFLANTQVDLEKRISKVENTVVDVSSLDGQWVGSHGFHAGYLEINIVNGVGRVTIPGHANGSCTVRVENGMIIWGDYRIYHKKNCVYIWDPHQFKSESRLFLRCPKSQKFPLDVSEKLASDRMFEEYSMYLEFFRSQGFFHVKTRHPAFDFIKKYPPMNAQAEVLCKGLLIMHTDMSDWLLYLHSDVAFFTFNHPYMEFGDSFHKVTDSDHLEKR